MAKPSIIDIVKLQQAVPKDKDLEKRKKAVNKLRDNAVAKYGKLSASEKKNITQNQYVLAVLGKAANRKMLAIEKHGITTPAHKKANEWLSLNTDRTRFSTNPSKMSPDEVKREIYQAMNFISAKSSTMTGHKQTIKKRNETFEKMGIKPEDLDILFRELGKKRYGSITKLLSSDQIITIYKNHDTRAIIENYELDELSVEQMKLINKTLGVFVFEGLPGPEREELEELEEPALFEIGREREGDYL